jgi:membrane associated rhomboid family serine protease
MHPTLKSHLWNQLFPLLILVLLAMIFVPYSCPTISHARISTGALCGFILCVLFCLVFATNCSQSQNGISSPLAIFWALVSHASSQHLLGNCGWTMFVFVINSSFWPVQDLFYLFIVFGVLDNLYTDYRLKYDFIVGTHHYYYSTVGASGAISALAGAGFLPIFTYLLHLPPDLSTFTIRRLYLQCIYVSIVPYRLYSDIKLINSMSTVDHAAHIRGHIVGIIFALGYALYCPNALNA